MANEITISAGLSASKNNASVQVSASKQINMAGEDVEQGTQLVNTSAGALSLGSITGTPAAIWIRNLDSTNFIELALDSGMTQKFAKVLAGQLAMFPPAVATIYAKADTAAVRVFLVAVEA